MSWNALSSRSFREPIEARGSARTSVGIAEVLENETAM